MSKLNELFSIPEEKATQKQVSTPAKASSKKLSNYVQKSMIPEGNRITKNDLETLKNDLLCAINHMIPEGVGLHIFTRKNLIQFIGQRGSRGTKLCELRDFFYPTPVSEIDALVQQLRKEGLIQKNRCGWMSLAKKSI